MSIVDIIIIVAYLVGTTLFGCSFFFRKKGEGDGARAFMNGGGTLPTWAIALSVFATHVSSISFLALPVPLHVNLSIVFGTAVLVVSGLVVGLFTNKENRTYVKETR